MTVIQCDENVKRSICNGLRAKGLEMHSIKDENLRGASDQVILQFCAEKDWVLLTNDKDFFDLAKTMQHAGIIFITDQHASIGNIIRAVLFLAYAIKEQGFRNNIFYVP